MPNMEAIVLVVAEISAFIPTGIILPVCAPGLYYAPRSKIS